MLRRGLFKPSNNIVIIMDDESYFTLDGSDSYGNSFYHSYEGLELLDSVKYRMVKNFPEKVMVWVALSARGISEPFIIKSGNAINYDIYFNECIKKRLVKFIKEHHSDDNFVFWPDLASSHYAKRTLTELESLNIPVVPKDSNPPNVPQLLPIEHYWSILKSNVYKNEWTAKSIKHLKQRIRSTIKKTSAQTYRNLMRGIKTDTRKAADGVVLSIINLFYFEV